MGVHVEPLVEEDEKPSFGPTIDEEQTYAQIANKVVVLADTCHQEVLESDRLFWQGVGRIEEMLEMVMHPSLGLPIDEVKIGAVAASRAIIFPRHNPLQEYINRTCGTS